MKQLSDISLPIEDPASKLAKIKVLILDSSTNAAELIKNVLTELGFAKVVIANDGFQGVQIMKKEKIDLIFSDRELKVIWNISNSKNVSESQLGDILPLSGIHFTQRLRHSLRSPSPFMPVIMMIDNVTGQEVCEARDSGVNEIITRPINAKDFCEKMRLVIDDARIFITSEAFKGPDRRRCRDKPGNMPERRKKSMRIMSRKEARVDKPFS